MKNPTPHLMFSYGANTNLGSMIHRCPDSSVIGAAQLPGYKFLFRRHADVQLDPDSVVDGVLWEISDDDLESLDNFEGFPYYYIRHREWILCSDKWHIAWVYTMTRQTEPSPPSSAYLDTIIEGYQENNVPTDQIYRANITDFVTYQEG